MRSPCNLSLFFTQCYNSASNAVPASYTNTQICDHDLVVACHRISAKHAARFCQIPETALPAVIEREAHDFSGDGIPAVATRERS